MLEGGILYSYLGAELPHFMLTNPAETYTQKSQLLILLQQKQQRHLDYRAYCTGHGKHHTFPVLKKLAKKRKGGIH